MRTDKITNQSFGTIYLREYNGINKKTRKKNYNISQAQLLDETKTGRISPYGSDKMITGVIDRDFDTVELRHTYNELVKEQKKNPVNIILDTFLYDGTEPEDWFMKATVKGKEFEQDIYYNPKKGGPRPTTIDFLKKACKFADELHLPKK